jgi:hypothetical protein
MFTFMDPTPYIFATFALVNLIFITSVGAREWGGLKKSFVEASTHIQDKLDEAQKVSMLELVLMNLISFKTLSTTEEKYKARLSRRERNRIAAARNIEMRERRKSEAQIDSDDDDE